MLKQKKNIILASTSSIRKKILEDAGIIFKTIAPEFDEEHYKSINPNLNPKELSMNLAENKALSISLKNPDSLVIGSDQVCSVENVIFNKSKNFEQAFQQLTELSNKTHTQNNSTVIALNKKIIFRKFSKVFLRMRKCENEELQKYIALDKPWGCAGSYKYESLGKHLFAKINGDYYSILGLNIQEILNFLHKRKYINF